jgi:hypothetical protein
MGQLNVSEENQTPGTFTVDLTSALEDAGEQGAGPYWVSLCVWTDTPDANATAFQGYKLSYVNQLGEDIPLVDTAMTLYGPQALTYGPFVAQRLSADSEFKLVFATSPGDIGSAKFSYAVSLLRFA